MRKINSSLHYVQKTSTDSYVGKPGGANWAPNTDVLLSDEAIIIKAELAGIRQEDLELFVENSRLTIRGQREDASRSAKCKFLAMEIHYGPFECIVDIPEGYDLSQARATYTNGFLRVDVPQAKSSTPPMQIPIVTEE